MLSSHAAFPELHSQLYALLNTCYSRTSRHVPSDVRYMVARDNAHMYYANQALPIDIETSKEVKHQCKTR